MPAISHSHAGREFDATGESTSLDSIGTCPRHRSLAETLPNHPHTSPASGQPSIGRLTLYYARTAPRCRKKTLSREGFSTSRSNHPNRTGIVGGA